VDLYTTVEEAKEEIWKRWNDENLRKEVEQFLGEIPEVFKKKTRACLFRQIFSPNYKYLKFLDLIQVIDLKSLGIEYLEDMFLTLNKDKTCLGKMTFIDKGQDRRQLIYKKIINLVASEKKS